MVETIWNTVFTLPRGPAAITTPFSTATRRKPLTRNSRPSISMHTQSGMRPWAVNTIMALITSSLSAMGSMNLPKLVIRFRLRAMCPSSASVAQAST